MIASIARLAVLPRWCFNVVTLVPHGCRAGAAPRPRWCRHVSARASRCCDVGVGRLPRVPR
eukprot:4877216-Lingulodinium_polyedra.AAC.1